MVGVVKFCRYLVHLWPFDIFYGNLVYIGVIWYIVLRDGKLYQEKSGNPAFKNACALDSCQKQQAIVRKLLNFFKNRLPGVGSKPGSSQFHLFSHFNHFTAEPQRLPKG
jgi:hypothetical protein